MLINRLNHPFFHDAAWMRAMNVNRGKGTKFGTNFQTFELLFNHLHKK